MYNTKITKLTKSKKGIMNLHNSYDLLAQHTLVLVPSRVRSHTLQSVPQFKTACSNYATAKRWGCRLIYLTVNYSFNRRIVDSRQSIQLQTLRGLVANKKCCQRIFLLLQIGQQTVSVLTQHFPKISCTHSWMFF
jgi:hypothetical protein